MPQAAIKSFFLDDPDWSGGPAPPTDLPPQSMMGVYGPFEDRTPIVLFALLVQAVTRWM